MGKAEESQILRSTQFKGTLIRDGALRDPRGPGEIPRRLAGWWVSVLSVQGADGQRGGVVGTDAVARTKVGQEAPGKGVVGESENVGAVVGHVVEGDVLGLIIQEDTHPPGRDWQGQEGVFISACPVLTALPQPYHPEAIVGG